MRSGYLLCAVATLFLTGATVSTTFGRELTIPQQTCAAAESIKELGLDDAELQNALRTASQKNPRLKELIAKIEACQASAAKVQANEERPTVSTRAPVNAGQAKATPPGVDVPAVAAKTTAPTAPSDVVHQFKFLLRQDFTDVSIIPMSEPSKATGASIGYSNDSVTKNTLWSVQGTAIAAYTFDRGFGPDNSVNLYAGTIGVYTGLNKQSNSNPKIAATKDTDSLTYGGVLELGFDHIFGGDQWFRVKSGVVEDHLKSTTAWASTLEWIPVYKPYIHIPHYFSLPLSQIGVRFDPSIVVQYDTARNQKLLFSSGPDSLRIGPQFGLWVQPFADIAYLKNLNINTTYHRYYETYSGRYLYWFQTAATYNLDTNGTLGLTGSYQKGNDELTGKQVEVIKLTLSAKPDYCSGWCPGAKK